MQILFSAFILILVNVTLLARPIEITGVAATVNGKVVTKKEVRSLLAPTVNLLKTKYPRGGEAAEMEFNKAQDKIVEQLIENKIILSELEERGASIPDFVIDQEINRIVNEFFNGKEAEFRKLTAPIRKNITALEKKMDKLNSVLEQCEEQLGDTELYQAENKSKLTQVLSQQASAKSELEEVEMEWMTEQESLEEMQANLDAE